MAELNQTMNPGLQTLPQINTPQLFNGQLVKLKSIINNTGNQQGQLFVSATFTFGDVYDTSSKKKKKTTTYILQNAVEFKWNYLGEQTVYLTFNKVEHIPLILEYI